MSTADQIVVGVDDSPSAAAAVDWAAREAAARHTKLTIVSAHESFPAAEANAVADYAQFLEWRARRIVDRAIGHAGESCPGVQVAGDVYDGPAEDVLIKRSRDAALVVLGSRRLHRVESFLLGSVGTKVTSLAHCPVVVLRDTPPPCGQPKHVVAGVDATPDAQDVLQFAFDYASLHALRLHVIMCTRPDPLTSPHGSYAQMLERAVAVRLGETMAGWQEEYPDVHVTSHAVAAHTVPELVDASAGQSLLVVGRHRRAPILGALLGSASHGVLYHASCPVAVVPTDHEQAPQ